MTAVCSQLARIKSNKIAAINSYSRKPKLELIVAFNKYVVIMMHTNTLTTFDIEFRR